MVDEYFDEAPPEVPGSINPEAYVQCAQCDGEFTSLRTAHALRGPGCKTRGLMPCLYLGPCAAFGRDMGVNAPSGLRGADAVFFSNWPH